MTNNEVIKNRPLLRTGAGRPRKYFFQDLEVGESISFEKNLEKSVRAEASRYGNKSGKVFACRAEPDSIGIWRVS